MTLRWGLSATIRASAADILKFAAYHLELGAHRLYLYLDDDNPDAFDALKSHSKIRVSRCDATHWNRINGQRPERHQVRQTLNATHAYHRRVEVNWLIHMDVDEFLVPAHPMHDILSGVPDDCATIRARPMELLGGSKARFKAFIPQGPDRQRIVRKLYPTFGQHLKGGFVSHVAGKVLVRTGIPNVTVQIHDALVGDQRLPSIDLDTVALAHCHATSWQAWRDAFDYRLRQGSYRQDIKPMPGAKSIHTVLTSVLEADGETGLRAFYDEVIGDSADMRARLAAHDVLRHHDLALDVHVRRHFPNQVI